MLLQMALFKRNEIMLCDFFFFFFLTDEEIVSQNLSCPYEYCSVELNNDPQTPKP